MKLEQPESIKALAKLLDAKLIGNENLTVTGVNEIHKVEEGDITFVDHPKYYKKALYSSASAIIINSENESYPEGKSLLVMDKPFDAYITLVKKFKKETYTFNQQAAKYKHGNNCSISLNASIGDGVEMGDNCTIHNGVVIYNNCKLGNNVTIHANSVIGADAFYYKKKENNYDRMISCGNVMLDDDVEIGALCTIDRGVSGDTVIGAGTKMDNMVHVGHDTVIGKNCLFAAQVGIAGTVTIEDDVILWGKVGVNKDLTIGKGAVVLGNSGVGKDLPGNKSYWGSPVIEARAAWKELALIRKLPEIVEKLNEQQD
ncbi:MAG: UDP-3-O-(3-hydroxymyristoyl)glucosamine N-acyltransferase [Bacteroidia bacterium]|nr:UDP-3-O-(3-hydroxymyristoyl)glucosamine N-acyltransferase [Bacteroidia bacterium]NNC85459.1 UDP-3-O-(3-hydroxymyristoyl)glucosamine N-acyltransferase [Bacteroidia bacterium]NNM16772.1 UDP-3-O-(3-hydroxymyristoyl)glucosamine N-acyltransferase [Bacteroidia bacterium]